MPGLDPGIFLLMSQNKIAGTNPAMMTVSCGEAVPYFQLTLAIS